MLLVYVIVIAWEGVLYAEYSTRGGVERMNAVYILCMCVAYSTAGWVVIKVHTKEL